VVVVRDATYLDLSALEKVRDSRIQFIDYLERADGDAMRFLVYVRERVLLAFAVLYLRQPPSGRLAAHLPRISDLYVADEARSAGVGTASIARMEKIAAAHGFSVMHMSVDPVGNPRAAALYERLGYVPAGEGPYRKVAYWEDDEGRVTEIVYWRTDLVKQLRSRRPRSS
jgi:GNAT superfamily N-acetyltransferase